MSKQLLALQNYILFSIKYCNKGYCSTYEGLKHAPFFVCCLIVISVAIVLIQIADSRKNCPICPLANCNSIDSPYHYHNHYDCHNYIFTGL